MSLSVPDRVDDNQSSTVQATALKLWAYKIISRDLEMLDIDNSIL